MNFCNQKARQHPDMLVARNIAHIDTIMVVVMAMVMMVMVMMMTFRGPGDHELWIVCIASPATLLLVLCIP